LRPDDRPIIIAAVSEPAIRPITPADDPAVAAIIRAVMTEHGASGPGFAIHDAEVEAMHAAYQGPGAIYFVIDDGGEVIGGGGIAPLAGGPPDTCELKKMYFLPRARGRGVGRRLLERCLAEARTRGYRRCYLETLESMGAARALYEKLGFRPLAGALGATGHFSCDRYYALDLADVGPAS
jgi:putative acetyltransferase